MLQAPSPCRANGVSLGSDILTAIGPYAPAGLAPWIHDVRGRSLLALCLTAVVCHHEKDGDDEEYPQQGGDCSKQHKGICDGDGISRSRCRGGEQRLPDHGPQYSAATAHWEDRSRPAAYDHSAKKRPWLRAQTRRPKDVKECVAKADFQCIAARTPPASTTGTT